MTILSVNKTRETEVGALRPFFAARTGSFDYGGYHMRKTTRTLVYGAVLAAIYVILTHLQNLLLPGTTSMVIQFRLSEALCVMALFTPAAIPGLSIGCLLYNLTNAGAMPLDPVLGTLATALACGTMWLTRKLTIKNYPLPALLCPAIWNALLVGWELQLYFGGGFWLNALYVAIGELAVLLVPGSILWYAIRARHLEARIFGR